MDSDKKNADTSINSTKTRILNEFENFGGLGWVTKGKEVENYIPSEVVDTFWEQQDSSQVEQFESFFEYLDNIVTGQGTKYKGEKPLLAENLIPNMTKDNLNGILDLNEKMNLVCSTIQGWNSPVND